MGFVSNGETMTSCNFNLQPAVYTLRQMGQLRPKAIGRMLTEECIVQQFINLLYNRPRQIIIFIAIYIVWKLIQCPQRSLVSVGWPQGLDSPCACIWALVARIAVVWGTDLCRSLPWTDHCFGHYLGSLFYQFSLMDRCFGRLFCQLCASQLGSGSW